jgi:hypothetical protein
MKSSLTLDDVKTITLCVRFNARQQKQEKNIKQESHTRSEFLISLFGSNVEHFLAELLLSYSPCGQRKENLQNSIIVWLFDLTRKKEKADKERAQLLSSKAKQGRENFRLMIFFSCVIQSALWLIRFCLILPKH